MAFQILAGTPLWVWAILLALVALGLTQAHARRASLWRVLLLPLGMTGLSLSGTFTVLDTTVWNWALWGGAALVTLWWFGSAEIPAGVRYRAADRVFTLPGSWVPLGMMMAIFLTRYAVGVTLSLHPALVHDTGAAAMLASLYGALSGIFLGRTVCLLRATRPQAGRAPAASDVAWG